MNDNGWIKIYYKMLDWEWMDDPYVVALWVRILLNTSQKERKWHGLAVKRGQWMTSVHHIAEQTGWSRNTVKRILRILEQSKQITIESGKNGVLITVTNYGKYQCKSGSDADPLTEQSRSINDPQNDPQGDPQGDPLADPNLRSIDSKKERKKENITHTPYAREDGEKITLGVMGNVRLTASELDFFKMRMAEEGRSEDFSQRVIDRLSVWLAQGRTCDSHLAALVGWAKTAVLEDEWRTGSRPKVAMTSSTANGREAELKEVWGWIKEEERKEYLDTHDGLTPWQYEQQHGRS